MSLSLYQYFLVCPTNLQPVCNKTNAEANQTTPTPKALQDKRHAKCQTSDYLAQPRAWMVQILGRRTRSAIKTAPTQRSAAFLLWFFDALGRPKELSLHAYISFDEVHSKDMKRVRFCVSPEKPCLGPTRREPFGPLGCSSNLH